MHRFSFLQKNKSPFGLYFLFFIFVVDLADEIYANQQCSKETVQNGSAVRAKYIQDGFCQEDDTNDHVSGADLFQIGRQVAFVDMFQMTFCVKSRLAEEGKNASCKKVKAA